MTAPNTGSEVTPPAEPTGETPETPGAGTAVAAAAVEGGVSDQLLSPDDGVAEARKRRALLIVLLLLLLLCCCVSYLIFRYATERAPLPELVPFVDANYPPAYKFSITGLDTPLGVTVSADGQRIYGSESGGQRLIKMFDRDGNLLKEFAPPFTNSSNRQFMYMAVDAKGRVFVVDTYNNVIAVFDRDGNFLDGIIGRDSTLSDVVVEHVGGKLPTGTTYYYDNTNKTVIYQLPGQDHEVVPDVQQVEWSPLGIRVDAAGDLLVTNIVAGKHEVLVFPAAALQGSFEDFNPKVKSLGVEVKEDGQLSFPNSAVTDSRGNYYVSDANNGRIAVWTPDLKYKTFFGMVSSESELNLPHGIWMDDRDRLHVVDTVGQVVRVYDVSREKAGFLYEFGSYGAEEAQFNFPNDIVLDGTGRLYIADRENDRIQVWPY
jgi:sugar lactone lactonase YvrE